MLDNLESSYNCANASTDLPHLLKELEQLENSALDEQSEEQQHINRIRNQIHFIRNKCDITHANGQPNSGRNIDNIDIP